MSSGEGLLARLVAIETQIAAERERVNLLIGERDKALSLQFQETTRRLEGLNHEGDRIRGILEKSVPREIYDNYVKDRANADRLLATQVEQVRTTLERSVETVKTTLEKSSKETTDRLEAQIKELRDRSQVTYGEKAGLSEALTRTFAFAGVLLALAAIVLNH